MEKVCEALSEGFMNTYPNVHVSVEYTGSSAGIESLTNGLCDMLIVRVNFLKPKKRRALLAMW